MSQPDVPDHIESVLQAQSAEVLREVARRAQEIADAKMVQELSEDDDEDELDEFDEELEREDLDRDEAPAGATLTVKTINDNDYYYWQWRADSGKIKSEYIKPVNPKQ